MTGCILLWVLGPHQCYLVYLCKQQRGIDTHTMHNIWRVLASTMCCVACYGSIDVLMSQLKTDPERVGACAAAVCFAVVLAWALTWAMSHVDVHVLL